MFTIFHVLSFAGACLGLMLGWFVGAKLFGVFGGIIVALAGGSLGLLVGRVPYLLAVGSIARQYKKKTTQELRTLIHDPDCMTLNCCLLELQSRGEDIGRELPVVLDFLEAENQAKRGFGWAALTSAFPELAAQIRDYSIADSMEECRRKTEMLRPLDH